MMKAMLAALALTTALPAAAAPSPDKLLDLRQPSVVATALRDAGYVAEVKTNKKGEPYVLSRVNGSEFTIEFYGCTGLVDCASYQFASWFKAEPYYTAALANKWNLEKRFLKVAIDKDGNLNEWMDFTATGKATYANFADIVDWYKVMDAELAKFLVDNNPAAAPTK